MWYACRKLFAGDRNNAIDLPSILYNFFVSNILALRFFPHIIFIAIYDERRYLFHSILERSIITYTVRSAG